MLIRLHSEATTVSHCCAAGSSTMGTKVRAAIQASDEPGTVLAERFGDEED
jgi:hypothetical protein